VKRKSVLALVVATGTAAVLSGCYVVPIDSRHPLPQQLATPGSSAVVIPGPHAVPVSLEARLYPLNEMAGKMGALTATVVDRVNGQASFSLTQGGELLQGEASRVPAGYPGFGKVHHEVYGQGQMPTGQRGIASASGNRGTYVNCEYALTASNRGTGACLFSNGAKYQLHFGS
jgi:hypothetical protein